MTVGEAQTHRSVANADFEALVAPHLRALHVHCYRMLGSLHEAEDLVQETLFRAWRRLDTYAGRAPFGAGLYGIATNACIDALARRRPRVLPRDVAPPDDPTANAAPPRTDVEWLEPYPDALLDPASEVDRRETVRLAFIAAVQQLPPRQRAALLLRDVLGWSTREVAELLGTTQASVNSALQRARAPLSGLERPPNPDEAAIVARYIAAWDAADVDGLAALLREDVEMTMPPTPSWYRGRTALTRFFHTHFRRFPAGRLRLVETRANAAPALAVYDGDAPFALKVLNIEAGGIRWIAGFVDPSLFPFFSSSPSGDAASGGRPLPAPPGTPAVSGAPAARAAVRDT
jgi:RNA polymerase sigma-70 factor (ECF subfamily)